MNFLSHFYFDRENTNCYQVLGTVLPDLLKNADKHFLLHPSRFMRGGPEIESLLYGWQRHLEVDRIFHSSAFFLSQSHELKLALLPAIRGSCVKPFFLGHIALELLLDHLLISGGLVCTDLFYQRLCECEPSIIEAFLRYSGLSDSDRFFRFFDGFKKSRYLETYNETQQIVYALRRICMRIWEDPFSPEHEGKMNAVLADYKDRLSPDFGMIFTKIEGQLQS